MNWDIETHTFSFDDSLCLPVKEFDFSQHCPGETPGQWNSNSRGSDQNTGQMSHGVSWGAVDSEAWTWIHHSHPWVPGSLRVPWIHRHTHPWVLGSLRVPWMHHPWDLGSSPTSVRAMRAAVGLIRVTWTPLSSWRTMSHCSQVPWVSVVVPEVESSQIVTVKSKLYTLSFGRF